ncbi:MAG: hypothetical protein IKP09_09795, partial [Lentisphaeria bacterium]|nr:hypothetical protein [Lentisphaeria bacterium]
MLSLLLSAATLVVSRAITASLEIEEENERKARQLERETKKYQREMAQRRGEIVHARAVNNHKETIEKIKAVCKAKDRISKSIKNSITSKEAFIASHTEKMEQAIEEKAKLNREIKKQPKESEDYTEGQKIISQYTAFIQKQKNLIKSLQEDLNQLQDSLFQIEYEIKELEKQEKAEQQKLKRLNTSYSKKNQYDNDDDDDD